ncbi:uncharacterized protein, partial [Miscanthus floridulus]|uniref:uncharacterized protein n=1 Tax=Miscanthus floridulus TaxID=154761 RepID=UPI00345A9A8D
MEDAIGQIICRGDTVTILNPSVADHCGVVLWKGRPGPNKDGSTPRRIRISTWGQRVGGPPCILRASGWLKGYWKPNHGEGTVCRVETTCVLVYWVASSSLLEAAAVEAAATRSEAPDGARQRGVPSTSLVVWYGGTNNDLFPGQHVVRRTTATTEPPEEEEDERVGVVRGYDYKDQTVRVSWESDEEETLSAYDVSWFSCDVHYGDIVVRRRQLPSTDSPSSTSTTTSDLSWVGQYVYCDCDDAQDNNINGEDDDNSGIGSGDDSGSESDDSSGSESDSEDNGSTYIGDEDESMYLKSGFMEPEASRTELTAAESLNVSTHVVGDDGDVKNTSTAEAGINGGGGDGGACTREDKMEAHTTAGYDKPFQFPQFEIVHQSPSDHRYLDNVKQVRNFLFSDQSDNDLRRRLEEQNQSKQFQGSNRNTQKGNRSQVYAFLKEKEGEKGAEATPIVFLTGV